GRTASIQRATVPVAAPGPCASRHAATPHWRRFIHISPTSRSVRSLVSGARTRETPVCYFRLTHHAARPAGAMTNNASPGAPTASELELQHKTDIAVGRIRRSSFRHCPGDRGLPADHDVVVNEVPFLADREQRLPRRADLTRRRPLQRVRLAVDGRARAAEA